MKIPKKITSFNLFLILALSLGLAGCGDGENQEIAAAGSHNEGTNGSLDAVPAPEDAPNDPVIAPPEAVIAPVVDAPPVVASPVPGFPLFPGMGAYIGGGGGGNGGGDRGRDHREDDKECRRSSDCKKSLPCEVAKCLKNKCVYNPIPDCQACSNTANCLPRSCQVATCADRVCNYVPIPGCVFIVVIDVVPAPNILADATIPVGGTEQFSAIAHYSDGSTANITAMASWSSSNVAIATVSNTSGSQGLATGVSTGLVNISASLDGQQGSASLEVSGASLVSIAVTPANMTIDPSSTLQFTATGHYSDGTNQNITGSVTWSSSDTSVATISVQGLATGAAAGNGTTSITAMLDGISGSTNLSVGPPTLLSITVTPANMTIDPSSTLQFTATGHYSDGTNQDITGSVTWASTDTSVATISAQGLATGAAGGNGTTSITAMLGTITGSTNLTVEPATLLSITVTPANLSIALGLNQQYTATGHYSDGTNQDITTSVAWSSSNLSVATISAQGLASSVNIGTTGISAMLDGISGSTGLTVTQATLQSITVTPANMTIDQSSTLQFTATGHYSDGTNQNITSSVTWSSSIATVASISAQGLATGAAGGNGTTVISAVLDGVTGSTNLSVQPATLLSITVTPANMTIDPSSTLQFTATGHYSDGTNRNITANVTWSSSNTAVATISAQGLATGAAAGNGTTVITAMLDGVTGSTNLTVEPPTLLSITVTPANMTIDPSSTLQFTATGHYSDGTNQDITTSVTWASSNTAVATISAQGLATGAAAGNGTTSITAVLDGITGSTNLTVEPRTLVSITVAPANVSIGIGLSQQYRAIGNYSDGTNQDITGNVTWSSSNTGVATISTLGNASSAGIGSTTITAILGGISGSTGLTVTQRTLQSILITPGNMTILPGSTLQFTATAIFSDNTTSDVTATATWSSSLSSVATISPLGLATAAAAGNGTTTITAIFQGVAGNTTLTVSTATLDSITVTPANSSMANASSLQFTATGHYSDGRTPDITTGVSWSSANNIVASIDALGLAKSHSLGTTTITATLGGISGNTGLTVIGSSIVSIAVTPTNQSISFGSNQQFTATATLSNSTTEDITNAVAWSSSNTAVAVITSAGANPGLGVSTGGGTTTITATLGALSGSTELTVTGPTLASIAVTPVNQNIPSFSSQQFTATATYSDATTAVVTTSALWSSSNPGAAIISNAPGSQGLAQSGNQGPTIITATLGAISGSTTLTVGPVTLLSITVTPADLTLSPLASQQYTATGHYSDSSTADLTTSVIWDSSDINIATVSNQLGTQGLASCGGLGTSGSTTVSARLAAIIGTTTLTVSSAMSSRVD